MVADLCIEMTLFHYFQQIKSKQNNYENTFQSIKRRLTGFNVS